jgi:hypothetical protein
MAEWAKWDRALPVDQIAALGAGFAPEFFLDDIAWYVNMFSGLYEENIAGLTVTNNGTTAAEHPPKLHYPSTARLILPAAVAPGGTTLLDIERGYGRGFGRGLAVGA